MAKKFSSDFSNNGSAAAADRLLIQKATDSSVNYMAISDLFSGIGVVVAGASSPALSVTGVGTDATVGLKFAEGYLGHTIVTGTLASEASHGVVLTSTNDYNAAFLADDAAANIGASVRNLLARTWLGATQAGGSIRSVMGQLKVADTKDLGTGVYTAVQAYIELMGATSVKSGGKVSGLDVSIELADAKTSVVDSGGYFAGVKIELTTSGTATFTQTGDSAAVYIDKSGTVTDWKVGVDINNCTTGIEVGASTTGINFAGTITTHISSTTTIVTNMPVSAVGAGFDTANGVKHMPYGKRGSTGMIVTEIYVDLHAAAVSSSTTDLDIIGESAGGAAYIGQITAANHGTIVGMTMTCIEVPATGVNDINLCTSTAATAVYNDDSSAAAGYSLIVDCNGAWTLGLVKVPTTLPAANSYLYLAGGTGGTAGAYSAGKFLIKLYGV